ncbi:MAG: anti-sigma factor antagonist [Lachnospiraceae bacterium]|nr:anti-sigma factor antagonist [Lachnospiraceae bacterium]
MYEQSGGRLTVHLPSELDHHTADGIRKEIDKKIMQEGVSAILFDFSNTTFMDSSGVGLLMGRYKMVSYVGGSVYAVRVPEKIEKLLCLANVEKYVHITRGDR